MPATGPERVPIGKGAMSPFLAQILRQINDAAARGSQGDPAKAIKIRDDLLEQIARPVLEGAISKATRDMAQSAATGGAMAHAAAKERVGKLHLKLNELTSEAVGQMRVASAVIAAGATLGAKYMELKPEGGEILSALGGPKGTPDKGKLDELLGTESLNTQMVSEKTGAFPEVPDWVSAEHSPSGNPKIPQWDPLDHSRFGLPEEQPLGWAGDTSAVIGGQ